MSKMVLAWARNERVDLVAALHLEEMRKSAAALRASERAAVSAEPIAA